jgi:hypothetical protein
MQTLNAPHTLRNTIIGVLLAAMVSGIGWWVFFVTTNITAMKQQLTDGGNKQIVAELQNPKSPDSLRANLSTVIAQVQVAQVEGRKPVANKVIPLSDAIAKVVASPTAPSEAWQAASQLISYRSSSLDGGPNPSNTCVLGKGFIGPDGPVKPAKSLEPDEVFTFTLHLSNCTLLLDDPHIRESEPYKHMADKVIELGMPQDRVRVVLVLNNVHIVYEGGEIPAQRIVCQGCTFDLKLFSAPTQQGKEMIHTLLASNDLEAVNLKLS